MTADIGTLDMDPNAVMTTMNGPMNEVDEAGAAEAKGTSQWSLRKVVQGLDKVMKRPRADGPPTDRGSQRVPEGPLHPARATWILWSNSWLVQEPHGTRQNGWLLR